MGLNFDHALEARTQQIGRRLLSEARGRFRWARRSTYEEWFLQRMMSSDDLRIAALRFVDVLPALDDDRDLARHLHEYFKDVAIPLLPKRVTRWGLARAGGGRNPRTIARIVRGMANRMAKRFIAGNNIETAQHALHRLHRQRMGFTLDLLGEAVVSEAEASAYKQQYMDLLGGLEPVVQQWADQPLLDRLSGRRAPRLNLSVKISALYSQMKAVDPEHSVQRLKEELRPLLREAKSRSAFITLDMEHYDTKDLTLRVFREITMEPEFADWPDVGLAMQAYLRDTPRDIERMIAFARQRGTPFLIRLVRGAYWDYECVIAAQNGWVNPVWTRKADTDACYEHCLGLLMRAYPHIETAVATHNVRSLALATAMAEKLELAPENYEVQMLYGMADTLKYRVVDAGQRLRVYVPFGELIPGMAYLVRRLLENTGSQSFLRMGFAEDVPAEQLLAAPQPTTDVTAAPVAKGVAPVLSTETFTNEPPRRFTDEAEREAFAAALADVREQFGLHLPLLIGGEKVDAAEKLTSINPAKPRQVVGTTASAGEQEAEQAVAAANQAFAEWSATPARERARLLYRLADLLRQRRDTFAAWEVYEAGKPWKEADGDVCEAIDFINYYAGRAVQLDEPLDLHVPGETNDYIYEPRGPGVAIAPWNFPLAIPVGMSIAPVAAGNTVVLKPAPQAPIVTGLFADLVREAGIPDGVYNYLPGGDEAGKALVAHKNVHFIAFTGSEAAGVQINRSAADVPQPGQQHLKHVVAELGGKNAIIIDTDADLDDAVLGTVYSAFGYAGQKCSACSRAIVVGENYEPFLKRLTEAAASLQIGPADDPGTIVGPVIDEDGYKRITATIDEAAQQHRVALRVEPENVGEGYFIGPTIFADVEPQSKLAQDEIFGPVLAVMKAEDFDDALRIANDTRFALTGGVYSRSPGNLARARREFRVGNLYLNRKITGAIVNRQPFAGFKMSGTNSKAGGPDYLLHFLQPRVVTENTIRRGFSPDIIQ